MRVSRNGQMATGHNRFDLLRQLRIERGIMRIYKEQRKIYWKKDRSVARQLRREMVTQGYRIAALQRLLKGE